ncbi:MAG: FliM/FliN family flagellar motor switch protein [Alphaproteobacteria bacterium]
MSDEKEPSPTLPDFGEPTIGSALASGGPAGTVGPMPPESSVFRIPVQVMAVLGKAMLSVNDLLKLGRGAVIELDAKVGEPIEIWVNNRRVAKGELVVQGDRLSVSMTEVLKIEDG